MDFFYSAPRLVYLFKIPAQYQSYPLQIFFFHSVACFAQCHNSVFGRVEGFHSDEIQFLCLLFYGWYVGMIAYRHGNTLQDSCLVDLMDREAW